MNKGVLLDSIKSFAKGNLKETSTVVKNLPVSTDEEEKPKNVHEYRAIHEKEDITEYFDTEEEIKAKVKVKILSILLRI